MPEECKPELEAVYVCTGSSPRPGQLLPTAVLVVVVAVVVAVLFSLGAALVVARIVQVAALVSGVQAGSGARVAAYRRGDSTFNPWLN